MYGNFARLDILFFSLILYATSTNADEATVYIISPGNGATVSSPVLVQFGLSQMGIAPAGVDIENTGHHHLLLDTGLPPLDKPIPSDANHLHFGKGQTETRLELTPGQHTLQLILGDYTHTPHNPPIISEKITVIVQ